MRQNHLQSLMRGAWILSLGALITKVLSAVYRIPFQNLVGNTGFYVYQQVYPLYGLAVVLALSGGPVYISKRVASASNQAGKKLAARRALVLMFGLGALLFAVLFLFAPQIARGMADTRLTPLIRTVSWLYLIVPFVATARGYFQGENNMVATATSQVVEQITRVAIIIAAAVVGTALHWSVYLIGAIAMSGALFGGTAAAAMLMPHFRRSLDGRLLTQEAPDEGWGRYSRNFFSEGGALVLFSALMILLQLVDSFTVTKGLQLSGLTAAVARDLKGVYDRGQPLVQLGLVVATALSQSLLPALTVAKHKQADEFYNRTAVMMLHLAIASAVLATTGLMALMPFANQLLFGDRQGTGTLTIYVISVALVAAINAEASLLQSQDQFRTTTIALVAGVVVKMMITTKLTAKFGTSGSALATCIALVVTLMIIYAAMAPVIRRAIWHNRFMAHLVGLGLAVLATGWVCGTLIGQTSRSGALFAAAVTGVACLVVALVAGYKLRLLTLREMIMLPGGSQLMRRFNRHKRKE
ncbi:putative polysaccharide biosynthesis protein [Lacticaseibacillus hulanensis]|uniref:putative polysaccharide biosynthesis protein n=1 Tax=Lacticaseibacillus hulanensis TaxID=2493111 RepID=UPI000FD845E8|nr:polysaccharide biosynthesis protein [Lacticaseibacillus hulanensis]